MAIRCRKALAGLPGGTPGPRVRLPRRAPPRGAASRSSTRCSHFVRATLSVSRRRKPLRTRPRPSGHVSCGRPSNRPLRVCGMVPSAGEPGGGPFWVMKRRRRVLASDRRVFPGERWRSRTRGTRLPLPPISIPWIWSAASATLQESLLRPDALQRSAERFHLHQVQRRAQAQGTGASGALERRRWRDGTRYSSKLPAKAFTPVKTVLDLLRPEHQTS